MRGSGSQSDTPAAQGMYLHTVKARRASRSSKCVNHGPRCFSSQDGDNSVHGAHSGIDHGRRLRVLLVSLFVPPSLN